MSSIRYAMLEVKNFNFAILLCTCVLLFAVSFGISIQALLKVEKLENDLQFAREILNEMKSSFADMYDLTEFENETNDSSYESDPDVMEDYYVESTATRNYDDVYNDISEEEEEEATKTGRGPLSDLLLQTKIGSEIPRLKRDVFAATKDGVLIKSESYADFKKKNSTQTPVLQRFSPTWFSHSHDVTRSTLRHYEEMEGRPTPPPAPVINRKSRVMHLEDKTKAFKRVIKKPSLKALSSSQEQQAESEATLHRDDQIRVVPHRRKHRQRLEAMDEHLRLNRMRPQPAIHLSGDTSKYVLGQHHNYNGDGHLRHFAKTFVDWKPEGWVKNLGMEQHFSVRDGVVTIKDAGLYFVYAQIYYLDEHDTNGYRVYKNSETLLQCTTMTHSPKSVIKGNTCYTAAATYLSDGDQIKVTDVSESRYSLFEPGKSFFGILKLGDIKIK